MSIKPGVSLSRDDVCRILSDYAINQGWVSQGHTNVQLNWNLGNLTVIIKEGHVPEEQEGVEWRLQNQS